MSKGCTKLKLKLSTSHLIHFLMATHKVCLSEFWAVIHVVLALSICLVGSETETARRTALFIFGDSTVDPGNNNYIKTIPENQADYTPYGQNGFFQGPTGRFSDGRVIIDYIAEYAGLPLIPPFLQSSAKFIYGANFASGGAGVLTETNQGLVIDLQTQLKYFEEVRTLLITELGEAQAKELISEAVYFISIGSNDYLAGYLGNPRMQELYQPEEYVRMVIGNLTHSIQVLYEKGGRRFGFLSLSPLGCLPALRALNSRASDGGCLEEASALALAHNNALSAVLATLEQMLKGFYYCKNNFYDWLLDRITKPTEYGRSSLKQNAWGLSLSIISHTHRFKDGVTACCGTGPYGGIFTCGGTKNVTEYHLCEHADEYVWWDSFHASERIHEQCARAIWSGPSNSVGPYSLEDLFFNIERKHTIADIADYPKDQQMIY
ncbi:GDSL lipase/esterase [Dillenia turbinata]|uniref:GDSL lipase/esterase n=1 Tax=Dillenia turbinata TaxID=194707 RepID=A0AAN8ZS07_9MAGN